MRQNQFINGAHCCIHDNLKYSVGENTVSIQMNDVNFVY